MLKTLDITRSQGTAIIQWPLPHASQEAIVAFLYRDQDALQEEYQRTALWKPVRRARGAVCSLYLEKQSRKQSYFNFGRRFYLPQKPAGSRGRCKFSPCEPHHQRIAVPIPTGAQNRRQVAKRIRKMTTLWAIFAYDDFAVPHSLQRAEENLPDACLAPAPGTEPILLTGLSTLGQFIPTRWGRCL